MDSGWAENITDLSMYSVIVPVLIGAVKYRLLSPQQKLVGALVLVTLMGELGVYYLDDFLGTSLPAIHFFTVLQFILLVLIMENGLIPMFSKVFFRGLMVGFVLFALLDAFIWNGIYSFNSYSRPMASFLLLFLALSFFYKTLKELKIKQLEREPLFWISIGILIYNSGNLFIFLFTNYVKTSNEALLTIWGIHAIFNIILNSCYSLALWIKPVN